MATIAKAVSPETNLASNPTRLAGIKDGRTPNSINAFESAEAFSEFVEETLTSGMRLGIPGCSSHDVGKTKRREVLMRIDEFNEVPAESPSGTSQNELRALQTKLQQLEEVMKLYRINQAFTVNFRCLGDEQLFTNSLSSSSYTIWQTTSLCNLIAWIEILDKNNQRVKLQELVTDEETLNKVDMYLKMFVIQFLRNV